jgi:arginase
MFWLYEHSREELDKSLLRRLDRDELAGIWIHFDVDALDPSLVAAVDSPVADGLAGPELVNIFRTLMATGRVVGVDVTIYDPDRDPGGSEAALIADLLVEGLTQG